MNMKLLFAALLCTSVAQITCSLNDRIAKVNDKIEMVKQNIKSGEIHVKGMAPKCGTRCASKCGNSCQGRCGAH
jgi:hypothetical protein